MTRITDAAPRGGLREEIGGRSLPLILDHAAIEKFEDRHRSIFAAYDGFFGRGAVPTTAEVRDLIALGLATGGLDPLEAGRLVDGCAVPELVRLRAIAQALIGIAFFPDADDEPDDAAGESSPEKPVRTPDPADTASGDISRPPRPTDGGPTKSAE